MKKKLNLVQVDNHENGKSSSLDPKMSPPEVGPMEAPPVGYLQMFRYSTTWDKVLLTIGIISTMLMSCIQPLNNLFFGDLTQTVVTYAIELAKHNSSSIDEATDTFLKGILTYSIEIGSIGIAMMVLGYISIETFLHTAKKQIYRIRCTYTEKILKQDISWYDQHQTGDFASKMADDLVKLEDGLGEKIPMFLNMQFTFIASILLAFFKGWELALVCLTSLPMSLICIGVTSLLSTKLARKESDAYGSAGAIAEEVLGTIRTVFAFNGEKKEEDRYDENLIFARKNNIFRSSMSAIGFGLLWFVIYASYALAFWYGVKLIIEERNDPDPTYTPGNMITIFFSVMSASMNFGIASTYVEVFAKAKASGGKIFAVIDNIPVINLSRDKGTKLQNMKANIEFKNVKFHYPTRKDVPVLTGLNLEIKSGQTVALVGSSGCGKSTCIQLLQRFYDPISGEVLIDGHNMKNFDLTWYRQNIAVVGQEPVLFATSIEENIRYGNMDATTEDIIAASKKSNAYEFIKALPRGFNTVIGERGAQLSGGQKQRIAIARALVRNPALLLLDEATSALDNESEAKVQAALETASKERTTVIVAHRLSTIKNADKIIVISHGKVVEEGTHDELMALNKEYFNLVTNQVVDKESTQDEEDDKKKIIQFRQLKSTTSVGSAEDSTKFNEDEEVDEFAPTPFSQILKMNKPELFPITIACLGSIITGASLPIFGLLSGDVIGELSGDDESMRQGVIKYCYFFLGVGVVVGLATFGNIFCFSYAGEYLTYRLRSKLFKAMLRQEVGWYDRKENGVGALCAKLSGEAALVQGATGQRLGTIISSISTLVLAVGLSLYYSWKLGLVTMAFTPVMFLALFMQVKLLNREDTSNLKSLEKSTKIAIEAVSNVRTVASLGNEDFFVDMFTGELKNHQARMLRNNHLKSFVFGIARSIQFFAYGTAMYYGGFLIRDGMPYVDVFKVSQILILGTSSIANALAFSPNLQKGISAARSTLKLMNRVPKIRNLPTAVDKNWKKGDINYSQLYFSYPTRPAVPVLRGLDLTVLQGKTVALVGSSGCGKSTLIQLIERFYDPISGSVEIDREDVRDMKLSSLRSNMGIVSQEPNLFDRTIGENIAYGDNSRNVTAEEIIEAAKKANIHNFISSLPLGYDTRLGEKGTQLSGGQKQRVAIARALVRNPKVLLLDEATSALDTESEKVVQEALDKAKEGRTCITIAHRLTTIQDADVICVIKKGKLAEVGTHQELLKERGLYHQLYSLQAV
ncbi:hypothetical protein WA026_016869 [Henosepilachna vigintioctopunctata]|uniref:ABC-type xenobiotic transporter n=1 Tax=Henosepilachna vigintioctopunctata TaxID=420089 RepID=A0AAW1U7S7_9CUCU